MRTTTDKPMTAPYLGISLGIVAVSFGSIFIRLADAPSLVIAAYRLTLASLILAPAAFFRSRDELRALTRGDLCLALLAGLFLGLHFATWITSLEHTSVASSVVFVDTHPLFVGLASHFLLRERLSRPMFIGILVAVLGGVIIGYGSLGLGREELLGDLLALAGAVMAAGYFLIGRRLMTSGDTSSRRLKQEPSHESSERDDASGHAGLGKRPSMRQASVTARQRPKLSLLSYIFLVYATGAVVMLAFSAFAGQPFVGYSRQTYLMFLLLAVVPQILGHSSFNWALQYLSATFVSVTVLGEPIGAAILATSILREPPTFMEVVGGALILAGIYIVSREEQRAREVLEEFPLGEL